MRIGKIWRRNSTMVALVAILALVVAACGADDTAQQTSTSESTVETTAGPEPSSPETETSTAETETSTDNESATVDVPIERFIVPYDPGGSTDTTARAFVALLEARIGEAIIVENLGGAAGTVGLTELLNANPDGTVIGIAPNSASALQPLVNPDLPWDSPAEFTIFGQLGLYPQVVWVREDSEFGDFGDFLQAGIDRPGEVTMATTGDFSTPDLAARLLESETGAQFTTVPFGSAAEAIAGVVGGFADAVSLAYTSAAGFYEDGEVRPLAVGAEDPPALMQDFPRISEFGIEQTPVGAEFFVFGPGGMEAETQSSLEALISEILNSEEWADVRAEEGMLGGPVGIDDTTQYLVDLQETLRELVESAD